ncbi:hypothetical protein LX15_004616 [Streptoalloteichus tenebrarius]|uniref:Band 7 domain-containing protein n=1 Tax=Streptoalloteichus tenebrarius (strain ATCC 17920 / DSM 40477 / JCM 4838 / CBS 697.72 / NBRC 16177 / NCIMB 11028 / NRRL B-12390 / A12253. 1 / ISP 5477) TaxID=1933 RepID=A0ABT1HZH9_STRSD|nr:hypothetical protein [Streptoalloteichus tenebrarius]MCP2260896.1 hypothetical protein [Streptoalloteichus tenebrarius]BFF03343.1 hypothetical protein GCM10020241_50180 [Streptoalloteichus tenebrarius]
MSEADPTPGTGVEPSPPAQPEPVTPPEPAREAADRPRPEPDPAPSPILEVTDLPGHRRFGRVPVPTAHTALVFDTADGRLVCLRRAPTREEWRSAGLTRCSRVDLSDHHWTSEPLDLPTARVGLRFVAQVRFGWRVDDPVRVVQRALHDAAGLGLRHLVSLVWPVARAFDPLAVADAEAHLNRMIGHGPVRLDEGVSLFHCSVRLDADPVLREHALTMARERQRAELHDYRCARVAGAVRQGQHALLARHLAQQPGDVVGVVRLLAEQERTSLEAAREIVAQLLDRNLARDVDLEGIGIDEFGVEALRIVVRHLRAGAGRALSDLGCASPSLADGPEGLPGSAPDACPHGPAGDTTGTP